ncbi:MAG TPA: hydantoinase B/oxoprolinase family protein [Steroidobacteraceae bacterium]|nr:hydantoinase B/oxoprolinase family protein [Steroidobacteraceae bacterium]
MPGWQFWIDRGGTFTDIVARKPDGALVTHKLLSENPGRYEDAAVQGIRELLGLLGDAPLPPGGIECVKMGTTVATNALLERKGDRTLFVTTRGFADSLRIAYQHRPKLFVRHIELPSMLYEEVLEVDERMSARGDVIRPPDLVAAERDLRAAFERGIRACAVVLMHGYRYSTHEQQLARLAREIGFTQVSVSHEVSPLMKLVSRGDTTVADAYLSPVLRRYVDQVAAALPDVKLQFMQSSGGLSDADTFHGKDAILSGPAGGIVGAANAARAAGCDHIIAFDMGGTSTDVGHFAGDYERALDVEISGVRLRTPILRIHTVAAGGGSICRFDGVRLRVGPESAGANPGPAAYRRGGPLTVTDCNVHLGRIQPDFFPSLFGTQGDEALDAATVERQFDELAASLPADSDTAAVAAGCIRIAVENMANAIKKISVQRGHDVTGYTLVCFGGAAGQHACQVADALGMRRVLVHPLAGVLSAYGIGLAETIVMRQQTAEVRLTPAALEILRTSFALLEHEAGAELVSQGFGMADIEFELSVLLKYDGTDSTLQIALTAESTAESLTREFLDSYRSRYGFHVPGRAIVIDTLSVAARGRNADSGTAPPPAPKPLSRHASPSPRARRPVYFDGEWRDTPFFEREQLRPGDAVDGPAVICERNTTIVIERGWRATLTPGDDLMLDRIGAPAAKRHAARSARPDPVLLEIFNNLFMAIAEQMGVTLANTASSVNIKERLDFSCALFDAQGQLIANAPHMPVHLGSMGESVQEILRRHGGAMRVGDAYALNAPYAGGTHLPDVTVVMPVFLAGDTAAPTFFVAARGHHADIGGITPGSMPAHSRSIDEEGVLIDSVPIVAAGEFLEPALRQLLGSGSHPARNVTQNLADLRAQVAACQQGITELEAMVKHHGLEVVQAYMRHVQDNAEAAVRQVIDVLEDGEFTCEMDSGALIRASIRIDRAARSAIIDFTGTSAQQPDNFNAPLPVTRAAVLYVFRTLVDDEIPMNAGCLKPLRLIVPEGSMLNPRYPAAVVAGNVETSQAVTDCLYGALGVLAASQGTMNNFTFGNERHQYYETISGGSGAGPGFDGTDAVQTHMTNSRLTDPEVLEWRFPVRLDSFRIRRGSGGMGRHRGGDGVERRVRFLEPMTAVMLANHRRIAPFGMAGGGPGAVARNWIERADGHRDEYGATFASGVARDDVIVIETPGGGGFGKVTDE